MKKNIIFIALNCSIFCMLSSSPLKFAWEALKNPTQVGAVFECSESVGHELMRYAKNHQGPKQIIEVGAGMGSVTKVICNHYLNKNDRVDVIKFVPTIKYDYIICTLPFNAFPNGLVKDLQNQLKSFSHSGTHLSYVEYMAFSYLRRSLTQNQYKAQQLAEHKKLIDDFKNRYFVQTVKVFKNIPPIYVHHLKISQREF